MVLMIIKGLFRRYERWNPVHPTYGSFWGMGVGIGCGVGWGPGFGPEVIGYVGAGCGVGFSVGITLAGVGIGLPAHFLSEVRPKVRNNAGGKWNDNISSQIRSLQERANESFSHLKDLDIFRKATEVFDVKNALSPPESFKTLKKEFPKSCKDIKD